MILNSGYSTTYYGVTAAQKGWGKGWPTCSVRNAGTIQTVITNISRVPIPVHSQIAELVDILLNESERRGYRLHPGWCWGGECRQIAGTNTASNHSWWLAFDINAPANPYTSSGNHDIPEWMFALFRAYGFGVGADYTGSKKDWMHFEFMGTPQDAKMMTDLARRNFIAGVPIETKPDVVLTGPNATLGNDGGWPLPGGHYLGDISNPNSNVHGGDPKYDSKYVHDYVFMWQTRLNAIGFGDLDGDGKLLATDGLWGPRTTAATLFWQRRNGHPESGVAARNDWDWIWQDNQVGPETKQETPRFPGTMQLNSTNPNKTEILNMQKLLKAKVPSFDYSSGPGIFGPKTDKAIREFQKAHGLKVDGIMGWNTWVALNG